MQRKINSAKQKVFNVNLSVIFLQLMFSKEDIQEQMTLPSMGVSYLT